MLLKTLATLGKENIMKKSVLVIDNDLNTCRELKSALEDEQRYIMSHHQTKLYVFS